MSALAIPESTDVERIDDPSEMVLVLMEQCRSHLVQARTLDEHLHANKMAGSIVLLTRRHKLSKELVIEAQELERLSERDLGLAIRAGQERGEFHTEESARRLGSQSSATPRVTHDLPAVHEAVNMASHSSLTPIYALADAPVEQFEQALAEAKAEGNLSRRNVVRKLKGESGPKTTRPEMLRGTRRLDSNRIVDGIVESLVGIDSMFDQIDYSALDLERVVVWVSSLDESIRSLTTLKNRLKKELTQ